MAAEANLLITYDPAHIGKAEDEVKALLRNAGEDAKFLKSDVEGVFLLRTSKDPKLIVKQVRKFVKGVSGYTYRWVPIDVWVKSDIASMGRVLEDFDKRMDPGKSWKIDVVKRHYDKASTTDLILKLTGYIDKPKVDLKNPQLVVKVEILGDKAGLALLNADETL